MLKGRTQKKKERPRGALKKKGGENNSRRKSDIGASQITDEEENRLEQCPAESPLAQRSG